MHRKAQVILHLIKVLYWLHKWIQILFSFASANLFCLNTWDGNDALFANSLDSDRNIANDSTQWRRYGPRNNDVLE